MSDGATRDRLHVADAHGPSPDMAAEVFVLEDGDGGENVAPHDDDDDEAAGISA